MMKIPKYLIFSISCLVLIPLDSWTQSISIASKDSPAGATIEIPVNVSANEDLTGLHLRLKFDPLVFLSPTVRKGPLLSKNHIVDVFSPQEGELNILAFSPQGSLPFGAHEGTVLLLRMTISKDASVGSHIIGFATPLIGSVVLPPSGLSGSGGVSILHTLLPGTVRILAKRAGDIDGNQTLNGLDIMLFSSWWRDLSDSSNSPANMVPSLPDDLIDVRDLLKLIEYLRDFEGN